MITELTSANYDATVASGVAVVDFWAEWCMPCRMMAPVVDELAAALGDHVAFGKVNVDKEQELAIRFGIASIPTILILKDGALARQFVGVTPKKDIEAAIRTASGVA